MIIGGSASQDLAAHVAEELNDDLCYVETKKFPDGERYLRVDGEIDDDYLNEIINLLMMKLLLFNLQDILRMKI